MHQAFEHHWPLVDVVVHRQVDPAQTAVRHATFDLVLVGDHIAGIELWQKRKALPQYGQEPSTRPACRQSTVPPAGRSSSRTASIRPQRD